MYGVSRTIKPKQVCEFCESLSFKDQFSGVMIGSGLVSVANFKRSALLTYVDLRRGANLALAFFA